MEQTKTYALVLYIDASGTSGDLIDDIIAVSSESFKLYELKLQKELESDFIEVHKEIDEDGTGCWKNTDVTNLYYNVIQLNVV